MQDQSHLDRKYFIDRYVYNCPFCNRNNVAYGIHRGFAFDWSATKICYVYIVKCKSCTKGSMHLSFEPIAQDYSEGSYFDSGIDIDSKIFYSVPTSFFVIDSRIPKVIRELVTEAEGCLKMNFLTGASACTRKAIYELLVKEQAQGDYYEDKVKYLKEQHTECDPQLFEIIGSIQDMTSDKIHEQSWPEWDSSHLKLIVETLKTILYEIYVLPAKKKDRSKLIQQLQAKVKKSKHQPQNEKAQSGD